MLTITHFLFGLLMGNISGNLLYVLLGSVIIDLDHCFQFKKEGALKSWKIFWKRLWHPSHNTSAKNPFVHSIAGWLIFVHVLSFVDKEFAIYFGIGYLGHLFLDLFDNSPKKYFWPLQFKHTGPLKYNSRTEYLVVGIIVLLLLLQKIY